MFIRNICLFVLFFPLFTHAAWTDFSQWVDKGTHLSDPVSGYDWLKLTETAGMSFTDIQASGLLNEWTYVEDVGGVSFYDIFDNADYDGALARLEAWGDTQLASDPYTAQSYVISGSVLFGCIDESFCDYSIRNDRLEVTGKAFSEELGDVFFENVEIQIVNDDILAFGTPDLDLTEYDAFIGEFHGHALVRVTPVPVTAAAWFLASALLGLVSVKRIT